MTAPYQVWIDDTGDHTMIDCQTLDEAIEKAKAVPARRGRAVRILGEGVDGGYGDDGSGFWDGLTEDERERCEEAGL